MRKGILGIVNELGIVSIDEVESILRERLGTVKKKKLQLKLKELEREGVIFKILSRENPYNIEGYIAGPHINEKDDYDIKELIIGRGLSHRDIQCIDWRSFSSRVFDSLSDDIRRLEDDLEKFYDDPKNVEMRYFDISIKYHEFYGFFVDKLDVGFMVPLKNSLEICRELLNKKQN